MENSYPGILHGVFDSGTRQIGSNGYHKIHQGSSTWCRFFESRKGKEESQGFLATREEEVGEEEAREDQIFRWEFEPYKVQRKEASKDKINWLSKILISREWMQEEKHLHDVATPW